MEKRITLPGSPRRGTRILVLFSLILRAFPSTKMQGFPMYLFIPSHRWWNNNFPSLWGWCETLKKTNICGVQTWGHSWAQAYIFCLLESLLHTAHAGRKASRNTESLREISADLTFSYSFVCQTRRVSVTFVVIELSLSSIKQRKLERFWSSFHHRGGNLASRNLYSLQQPGSFHLAFLNKYLEGSSCFPFCSM